MGTISKIKAPNGTTYNIDAVKVNGKTVNANVPSNAKFTDTTYSAGTGLEFESGTTKLKHTNSITAGTAGTSSATSGSVISVPSITYDARGHITQKGSKTHTISGFLKLDAGISLTEDLIIKSSNSTLDLKASNWTLTTASNNGLSATTYAGDFLFMGSNIREIGRIRGGGDGLGNTFIELNAYNLQSSGATVWNKNEFVFCKKDGTLGYLHIQKEDYDLNPIRSAFSIQKVLSTTTYSSGTYQRCYGKVVQIRISGTKGGSLPTVASSIRPPSTYYNPAIILGTGDKWYKGWIGITSAGAITARAVLSGTTATEVTNDSNYTIYGTITYIIS